jgi:hypothetical protein
MGPFDRRPVRNQLKVHHRQLYGMVLLDLHNREDQQQLIVNLDSNIFSGQRKNETTKKN